MVACSDNPAAIAIMTFPSSFSHLSFDIVVLPITISNIISAWVVAVLVCDDVAVLVIVEVPDELAVVVPDVLAEDVTVLVAVVVAVLVGVVVTVLDAVDVTVLVWVAVCVDDAVEVTEEDAEDVAVLVCVLLSQTKRIPSAISCVPLFKAAMADALSASLVAFTVIPCTCVLLFSHPNMSVESSNVSYSYIMR